MTFIPDIEKQPIEIIKAFQEEELKKLMAYLNANSPFYKRLLAKHNIDHRAVKTLDDLTAIPPTTKNDLQKFNWDFLCVPQQKIKDYTSTSGTLGSPVTIALTEKDLRRLAYNEYISFSCAGTTNTDLFQLMVTLDRQFMAGLAYHEGIRMLGAGLIRVGPGLIDMQWETIHRLKPTCLVAVPSFILKLLQVAKTQNLNPNETSIKKIICIGEPIRTPDLELNTLGRKIHELWNVNLIGTYASTEMQTAFTECEYGIGGHHHPELVIVEILNDNNDPVRLGEQGEVTITTLGVEGMPLLRYKTGDIVHKHTEACKCGRSTLRLGPIIGRKQQMIKLKGTTIYPQGIFELLNRIEAVVDYCVEVYTNDLGLDELKIHLVSTNQEVSFISVQSMLQSKLRITPEILFKKQAEMELLHGTGQNRKAQKFIDRRK